MRSSPVKRSGDCSGGKPFFTERLFTDHLGISVQVTTKISFVNDYPISRFE